MRYTTRIGACLWAVSVIISQMLTTSASAGVVDYAFELRGQKFLVGDGALLTVSLMDKRNGGQVPGAIIFWKRLDMAPDGMEAMEGAIELLPSSEPGVYAFRADLAMEGNWRLSLAAKVQGEDGTLQSELIFAVSP